LGKEVTSEASIPSGPGKTVWFYRLGGGVIEASKWKSPKPPDFWCYDGDQAWKRVSGAEAERIAKRFAVGKRRGE
jgi:hypothetical protein